MSDRVWFAQNTNGSLGSNFNGWTAPITVNDSAATGPGSGTRLIGESVKDFTRWLRIKKLHVAGSWVMNGHPPVIFNFDCVQAATRERDSVTNMTGHAFDLVGSQPSTDNANSTVSADCSVEVRCANALDVLGLRYNEISIGVSGVEHVLFSPSTFEGPSVGPGHSSGCAYTFLGTSLTSYQSSATAVVSGSIAITAVEYWPYAGLDGAPIYNTTTGALLSGRTPLS